MSPLVRAGRGAVALVFVLAPAFLTGGSGQSPWRSVGDLVAVGVVLTLGFVAWLVTRWRVEDGTLRIETGLIRRQSLRFPLAQLQAIDTVRPALARIFGLAELRLRMGGATGASGRLAYLPAREADRLRGRLLALAHGLAEDTQAPAEQILFTVPVGRLIASIVVSGLGLVVAIAATGLIVTAIVAPATAAAIAAGGGAAILIGIAVSVWRRFNDGYRLTVAEASDGLHVRSGLVETAAETIPRGRVQAVRMVEPLAWRPLGWCRLEVDIAGRQRKKRENRTQSRELRDLVPVGKREDALRLLERIVSDTPDDRLRPPARARLKSPLRFHNLAWARTETCVVTTTGRLTRVTAWVPLTKVQSLRRIQGPLQRRLRLATIHLDTAGKNVHATLRDRDVAEVDSALAELVDLCRAERRSDRRLTRSDPAHDRGDPTAPD